MEQEKENPEYQQISFDSLRAFCNLHRICFRDREDSTRVYPPGTYVGKEIDWEWVAGRIEEWNRAIAEI